MPTTEVDFLIVGQGLAGSLLAFELLTRDKTVMVVDNNLYGSSSQVAAGIINPITGHRLNLTHGFNEYFEYARRTYTRLERVIGSQIYRNIKQTRLIKNPGQANYFAKRLEQGEYQAFLYETESQDFQNSEFGTANVQQTFVVDTKILLAELKSWLISQNAYRSSKVDYQQLSFQAGGVSLEGISATNIIFCEGYQAINNPWLKNLPFKLAKGEILTVNGNHKSDTMLSWGNWYVPTSNGKAKLGSNYAWHDTSLEPSKDVREKLLDSLHQTTEIEATLNNHEVGIRPTTKDRHAFVGPITSLKNAYCFNGFGSKGCLTIPKYAHDLCDHILSSEPLHADVSQWL